MAGSAYLPPVPRPYRAFTRQLRSTVRVWLEVAWDVMGGRFAINGGGLDAEVGEVCYWGPDSLDWTGIGGGHFGFVGWALGGGPN
jgi:hypothetical protein